MKANTPPSIDESFSAYHQNQSGPSFTATPAGYEAGTAMPPENEYPPSDWPKDLPNKLPPVLPVSDAMMPGPFRGFVMDCAERMNCPPDFILAGLMCSAGSVLGRKVAIAPEQKTDWHEFPNLWAMAVGRPSAMKSPALKAGMTFIERLAWEAREKHRAADADFAKQKMALDMKLKAAKKTAERAFAAGNESAFDGLESFAVNEPTLRRYDTQSANFASLHLLLTENPNGLLLFNDELSQLLASFEPEKGQELKAMLLSLWTGKDSQTLDRIERGLNLYLPPTTISVMGGTQPGKIGRFIRQAMQEGPSDDGFLQRFALLCWPDLAGEFRHVDRWPDNAAKARAWEVFDKLDKWTPGFDLARVNDEADAPALLRFSHTAGECFLEWREKMEKLTRGETLHPALESHFIKYRKAVPALALLHQLIEEPGAEVVGLPSVQSALAWATYLDSHARRFYGAGGGNMADAARAILRRYKDGGLPVEGCTARQVYRNGWEGLKDRELVGDALEMLVDYAWVDAVEVKGARGGASTTCYIPTPGAVRRWESEGGSVSFGSGG
jgi:putative DNA primase/helicase